MADKKPAENAWERDRIDALYTIMIKRTNMIAVLACVMGTLVVGAIVKPEYGPLSFIVTLIITIYIALTADRTERKRPGKLWRSVSAPGAFDDRAVSPVIAVILMVAITVVLAATVFVLVQDIGDETGKPSFTLVMGTDDAEDRATVEGASPTADWSLVEMRVTNPVRWALEAPATATSPTLAADTWVSLSATANSIRAGDYVDLCGQGAQGETRISFRNKDANSLLGEYQFRDVGAC